jgi:hypothetical protein
MSGPAPVDTKPSLRDWLLVWTPERRFSNGLFAAAALWATVLAVAMLLYTQYNLPRTALAIVSVFAAAAVGSLIGFLFGIPKSRTDGTGATQGEGGSFRPNTNLEQVSDWLTKIIVGIGLVQFRELGAVLYDFGSAVGDGIRDPSTPPGSATTFAIALLVGSALMAFLINYMWTTTRLYDVFTRGNIYRATGDRAAGPTQGGQVPSPGTSPTGR